MEFLNLLFNSVIQCQHFKTSLYLSFFLDL